MQLVLSLFSCNWESASKTDNCMAVCAANVKGFLYAGTLTTVPSVPLFVHRLPYSEGFGNPCSVSALY
jgi:hypothetical protein